MPTSEKPSSANKRHVMITGCAGFIGKMVSREVAARGESMIGLYHQKLPESLDKMMPLCADLRNPETLLAPLRSVDTVIHLAWSGGILGSLNPETPAKSHTKTSLQASPNVLMTTNLVRSMERQGVKKIVFVSWIGADDASDITVLREKYWAENVILNSRIPEKHIIRTSAVIDLEDRSSEFALATQRIIKMPLFMPLPRLVQDLVFTSRKEITDQIISRAFSPQGPGHLIEEMLLMNPVNSKNAIMSLSNKWWGHDKWAMGGILGRYLFKVLDSEFGRLAINKAKLADFILLSRRSRMLSSKFTAIKS